jgi:hypothetical protein
MQPAPSNKGCAANQAPPSHTRSHTQSTVPDEHRTQPRKSNGALSTRPHAQIGPSLSDLRLPSYPAAPVPKHPGQVGLGPHAQQPQARSAEDKE